MEKLLLGFEFDVFEKASAGEKSRKIGGYVSTEHMDEDGEVLVQKGLDFSEFLERGWFNNNHEKNAGGVVGYPEKAEFCKGKGWYVEGYLLKDTKKADEIWEVANALKKSHRRLGFSVEGKITERNNHKVIKAKIRHVAITHVPINSECVLEVLSKSFCKQLESENCIKCTEGCYNMVIRKAIEAGHGLSPETQTGGGAVRQESLEGDLKVLKEDLLCEKCKKEKKKKKKGMTTEEIKEEVLKRGYSENISGHVVDILQNPKYLDILLNKEVT